MMLGYFTRVIINGSVAMWDKIDMGVNKVDNHGGINPGSPALRVTLAAFYVFSVFRVRKFLK